MKRRWTPRQELHALQPTHFLRLSTCEQDALLQEAAATLVTWSERTLPSLLALKAASRRRPVPVFALCEEGAEEVAALVVGADAVVKPPFSPVQIQALLIAYRRRMKQERIAETESRPPGGGLPVALLPKPFPSSHDAVRIGSLFLNRTTRRCFVADAPLDLTPREFDLLAFLMHEADACHTRDTLLERVWGINYETETNILDVHVYNLRRKLRPHGQEAMIETVRGVGYRLVAVTSVS